MVREIEIKNAVIEKTFLGKEDHGIFTFNLSLDYGGTGQGFGNYGLDDWNEEQGKRMGCGSSIDLIKEILEIVGVYSWEDLPGKHIRVQAYSHKVIAIGHFLHDKWFNIEDFYAKLEEESNDD